MTPPRTIKFDPALFQDVAPSYAEAWTTLDSLRLALYLDALPWLGRALSDAIHVPEEKEWTEEKKRIAEEKRAAKEKRVQLRADREWQSLMNLPPITSFESLEVVKAAATAAGYHIPAGLCAFVRAARAKSVAISLGNRVYRVDDATPIKLEVTEDTAVQTILDTGGAATKKQLEDSGVASPHKVLKNIVRKHPQLEPFFSFPGAARCGGYGTTILRRFDSNI